MKFAVLNTLIDKLNACMEYPQDEFDRAFEDGSLADACEEKPLAFASGETYLECAYDSARPFSQSAWRNLTDLAAQLHDDPIMDVLRGWEMEDGAWLPDSPLVLRFELQDVVLQPAEDGSLRIWHGILDDGSDCLLQANWLPNAAHLAGADATRQHRERCRMNAGVSQACWIPYPPLYSLIGTCTTANDWLTLARRIHSSQAPMTDCVNLLVEQAA